MPVANPNYPTGTVATDPVSAANQQNVVSIVDGLSTTGKFGALIDALNQCMNLDQTWSRCIGTPGINGIPAISTEGIKTTYSVAIIGFTPVATATDFFTITAGSQRVRVLKVEIFGQATAAATVDIQAIIRSSANTSGTLTTPNIVKLDTNNATATAVVSLYSVNPTLGTATGNVRAGKLVLPAAGGAGLLSWDFGTRNGQGIVLRGASQSLCLHWNGAAVPSGTSLCIGIEWVEENPAI